MNFNGSSLYTRFSTLLIAMFLLGFTLFITCVIFIKHMEAAQENRVQPLPLTANSHTKIIISDDNGSISIHARKTGPFSVVEKRDFSGVGLTQHLLAVNYLRTDTTLDINAHIQKSFLYTGRAQIDLDISVPVATDIVAYTEAGTIDITGLQGVIVAETGTAGSISVSNTSGEITLKTFAGSISANDIAGQIAMTTQRGDVDVRGALMTGSSQLEAARGSITFHGSLDRVGAYHFKTVDGPINITLPPSSAFRLLIGRGSGTVSNDFVRKSIGKGRLALVSISAQNNSIKVRRAT